MMRKAMLWIAFSFLLANCKPDKFKNAPDWVKIKSITLCRYPEFDGSDAWDDPLIGAPTPGDIYCMLIDYDTTVTSYYTNCSGDTLYYELTTPVEWSRPYYSKYIELWDKDDISLSDNNSTDDRMITFSFTPWEKEGDEDSTSILLSNTWVDMRIEVEFEK
jgi:hypothetical protein